MTATPATWVEAAFREHERLLWGLCYRMTGSAADAEDLVQDTFVRAMERPPRQTDRPARPWLVRVAMNASRDHLRRRRRQQYKGPWLPAPVEPASYEPAMQDGTSTAGRYDLMESVSFAFLLALEALTPQQRAVLLLRDVFDYSVVETSQALDISAANVKTTLHRARRTMRTYDRRRTVPTKQLTERTRETLAALMRHLAAQDVDALQSLFAIDARALSDGGGQFHAARVPVVGGDKIARMYLKLARMHGLPRHISMRVLNGLPALVMDMTQQPPAPRRSTMPPHTVLRCDIDASGRIVEMHSILAPRKLVGVTF